MAWRERSTMVSSFLSRGTSDSMHVNKNESSLFAEAVRLIIHFSFIASSTTTKQYIMYLSHAGKVPSDISLLNLLQSIPSPIPGLANALFPPSLVSIPYQLFNGTTLQCIVNYRHTIAPTPITRHYATNTQINR